MMLLMMQFAPIIYVLHWFVNFLFLFTLFWVLIYFLFESNINACSLNWFWFSYVQKWHPDKHKDGDSSTSRFQEINEAYQGLSVSHFLFET